MNTIFDCHLHVDKRLDDYNLELSGGNIIYNYVDQYESDLVNYKGFYKSLIFDYKNNLEYVTSEIHSKTIVALKIHTRIQQISSDNYSEIVKLIRNLKCKLPIIYDAFYHNSEIEYQPSLEGLIFLAKNLPENKFIVAHAGGYKILEYFFHLRDLKNISYDLSFSLQYLSDSSCNQDLIKLIKYTPSHRLFFGSDFPFGDPRLQFDHLFEIISQLKFSSAQIEGIFKTNWLDFTLTR